MREIFHGCLSGNGIRQASIAGEIAPDPTDAEYFLGRFAWNGRGVAVGQLGLNLFVRAIARLERKTEEARRVPENHRHNSLSI
jgi:hypothetical protein